jgi:hypothetical protein
MFKEYDTMGFFSFLRCCNSQRCMICTEKQQDCLTFPCCNNNYIVCKTCASNENLRKCPQCRKPFVLKESFTMVKTVNVKWNLIWYMLLMCSVWVLYGFGMNEMVSSLHKCKDILSAKEDVCDAGCSLHSCTNGEVGQECDSNISVCRANCEQFYCESEIADIVIVSIVMLCLVFMSQAICDPNFDRNIYSIFLLAFNMTLIAYFATSSLRHTPNTDTLYVSYWAELLYVIGLVVITVIIYYLVICIKDCFPSFKKNNCCYEINETRQSNVKITVCEQTPLSRHNTITPAVQKCDV